MCGRFTLAHREARALAAELGVPVESLMDYKPCYNIAPTDPHWIVRSSFEDREVLPAKWGLVNFWMTDRKQAFKNINARAETIQTSRSFREAFKERRCVIPADGFFEWTGHKDARQPVWYHRPDRKVIYFAGLYESWRPTPEQKERTFTIITTTPNLLIEPPSIAFYRRLGIDLPDPGEHGLWRPEGDPLHSHRFSPTAFRRSRGTSIRVSRRRTSSRPSLRRER